MKKFKNIQITVLMIALVATMFYSCKKDKTDPVITWANPADISVGTLLSSTQLNAIADVQGIFVYTPATGTKLSEGDNQGLKADFIPTDTEKYNSVSKAVVINVKATSSGGVSSAVFNPNLIYGTMTDQEGNIYKTITIGTQTWTAENLRVTKYRNGDPIPNVTDITVWSDLIA